MSNEATSTAASAQPPKTSRVGKRPIDLPKGVTVTIGKDKVDVKGPKGSLSMPIPPTVSVEQKDNVVTVHSSAPGRDGARFQGLARALLGNMVHGAAEGYTKTLEFHGTGYRAELKGKILVCNLGFSHLKNFPVPDGLSVDIPKDSKGQVIILTGPDKAVVGQSAATIRGYRPAEPYGGKGVRYRGEHIRQKAGKAGK